MLSRLVPRPPAPRRGEHARDHGREQGRTESRSSPSPSTASASAVDDPTLADPNRPIWIVNEPPLQLRLRAHEHVDAGPGPAGPDAAPFTWKVTPVRSGTYSVRYRVAAGLYGKAKAELTGRRTAAGAASSRACHAQPRPAPTAGPATQRDAPRARPAVFSATAKPSSSSSTRARLGRVLHRAHAAVERRPLAAVEDRRCAIGVVERGGERAGAVGSSRARPAAWCTASFHSCVVLLNAVQGLNASMKLKPGCLMPSTISSVSSFERKLAPRATNEQSAAIAVATHVHRLLEVPERRRGRLLLVQRGRRDLALGEAVGLVVHDHVGDVDVAARGVREVAAADREAVAVAADRDHVELGVGELHAHRGRQRAAVDAVEPVGRDEAREAARAADARRRSRSGRGRGRARRTPGRRPRARRSRRSPGTRSASGPT